MLYGLIVQVRAGVRAGPATAGVPPNRAEAYRHVPADAARKDPRRRRPLDAIFSR